MKTTPRIVVGVTGSIAAYKAAELVRQMKKRDWDVTVIMTRAATEFVGELTFRTLSQNPVGLDMFAPKDEWHPEHLSYAERADVLVIAPCTANVLAKIAHGLADDLLSCTALATQAPVVVAPAMHTSMLKHPATQANLALLKQRGVTIIAPGVGDLACGAPGRGRMAEPADIMARVAKLALKSKR